MTKKADLTDTTDPGSETWRLVRDCTPDDGEPLPSPLTEGCRIVIPAKSEEGEEWPEERGVLCSPTVVNGTVVVLVDEDCRDIDGGDDGLRELAVELVQAA